jgi:histidinol-phosphate phosphatase family protein
VLCSLRNDRGAVFLDRDGVINRNRPDYVRRWDQFEFLPGALEAIRSLARENLSVLVVSNQSAIGRGLMSTWDLEEINTHMLEMVSAAGGRIDGAYYCPHSPDEGCLCRKPAPGLLLRAMRHFGVDPGRSCLVGDAVTDLLAAQEVGIPSIRCSRDTGGRRWWTLACEAAPSPTSPPTSAIACAGCSTREGSGSGETAYEHLAGDRL